MPRRPRPDTPPTPARPSLMPLEPLEPRLLFSADPLTGAVEGDTGHGAGCCCPGCAAAETGHALPPGHFHGDGHDHNHNHDHHVDAFGVAFDPLDWFTGAALPTETTDAAASDAAASPAGTRSGFSLNAVPELQSDPGAYRTLYLDFNGQTIDNTLWNNNYHGGETIHAPAFDLDGDIFSFSQQELDQIEEVWQRVAEDFAPFDINVSTVAPPTSHLTQGARAVRVLVSSNVDHAALGGDGTKWYNDAGGVARIGSWTYTSDTPAWVFSNLLLGSAKNVAEAVSHEAGHTFGLVHDGQFGGVTYYTGHGSGATSWAPIMGASYARAVTQWSRGEYDNANNNQDDLAIITNGVNGISFRADDHADSRADATLIVPLVGGRSIGAAGFITTDSDTDYFAFDTGGGLVEVGVSPAAMGANLDLRARLYDSDGTLVETSSSGSTLGASFSRSLDAGRYYLRVEGVGHGDPGDDGYSGYASLGRYHLVGSVPPVETAQLPTPLFGDVDGDYTVGQPDLDAVLAAFGTFGTPGPGLPEDLSGDGYVGVEDLDVLLMQWGESVQAPADGLARYWAPTHGGLGLGWTETGFDDTGWALAVPGIGYETSGNNFAPFIETHVPGGTGAVYLRSTFTADDPAGLDGLGLTIRYDDGFVAYLNGQRVASHNAPDDAAWDDAATDSHADSAAEAFAWFDLTDHLNLLNAGENTLAVHVLNRDGSSDLLLEPELVAWFGASGSPLPAAAGSGSAGGVSPTGLATPDAGVGTKPRPTTPDRSEPKRRVDARQTAMQPAAMKRQQGIAAYTQRRIARAADALMPAPRSMSTARIGTQPTLSKQDNRGTATTPRRVADLLR